MNTITVSLSQNNIIKLVTNKFTMFKGAIDYYIFSCDNNYFAYKREQKYKELFENIKIECDYYSVMKVLDCNLFFFLKDRKTNEIIWGKNINDTSYMEEIEKYSFYLERLSKHEQNYFLTKKEPINLVEATKDKSRMIIDIDYYFYWKLKYEEDVFNLKDKDFE